MKVGIIGLISFSNEPAMVTNNILKVIHVYIDQINTAPGNSGNEFIRGDCSKMNQGRSQVVK
jgi:hypothetical protein